MVESRRPCGAYEDRPQQWSRCYAPALGFGTLIPDPVATRVATKAAPEQDFASSTLPNFTATKKRSAKRSRRSSRRGRSSGRRCLSPQKSGTTIIVLSASNLPLRPVSRDSSSTFVDLYLIHTPFAFQPGEEQDPRDANGNVIYDKEVTLLDTWRALEGAWWTKARCKAIGLSDVNLGQTQRDLRYRRGSRSARLFTSNPIRITRNGTCWTIAEREWHRIASVRSAQGHSSEPKLLEDPVITAIAKQGQQEPRRKVLLAWAISGHGL